MKKKCVSLFIAIIFMAAQVQAGVLERASTILPFLTKDTGQNIKDNTITREFTPRDFGGVVAAERNKKYEVLQAGSRSAEGVGNVANKDKLGVRPGRVEGKGELGKRSATMSRRKFLDISFKAVAYSIIVPVVVNACTKPNDEITPPITEPDPIELPDPAPEVISVAEATVRARQYVHFGVNQTLQFPYDFIALRDNQIDTAHSDYRTQPTLIGFYVQYLLDVIKGNETSPTITQEQARKNLSTLLGNLTIMQGRDGWKGLLPTWSNIQGGIVRKLYDTYAVGDNLNLSAKLFMIKGALGATDPLWKTAEAFLAKQEEGYATMVDTAGSGRFWGSYENGAILKNWQIDRISTEFAPGIAWAAAYYGQVPRTVFDKLRAKGTEFVNTWNGDAFTYSWPLLTFDPTDPQYQMTAWQNMYSSYLARSMNESRKANHITLSDPAFHPYGGYLVGGRWALSEGGFVVESLGSVHGLRAFRKSEALQSVVDAWDNNMLQVPGLVTIFGRPDGIIGKGTEADPYQATHVHTGVGKFAELLASIDSKGNEYFMAGLTEAQKNDFLALYRDYSTNLMGVIPVVGELPQPVDISTAHSVVSDYEYDAAKIPPNEAGFEWCRWQRAQDAIHLRHFIANYIQARKWKLLQSSTSTGYYSGNPIDHPDVRGIAEWYTGVNVLSNPDELRKRWMPAEGKTRFEQLQKELDEAPWIDHGQAGKSGSIGLGAAAAVIFAVPSLESA
jgi:hypothetical protein